MACEVYGWKQRPLVAFHGHALESGAGDSLGDSASRFSCAVNWLRSLVVGPPLPALPVGWQHQCIMCSQQLYTGMHHVLPSCWSLDQRLT